jgi:putative heme-binding domain-containing protein
MLVRLAARVGNSEAVVHAGEVAQRNDAPQAVRIEQISTIGRFGGSESVPVLLELVSGVGPDPVREAALDALRRIPDDRTASALVALYPTLDEPLKTRARDVLFSRAPWSLAYVQAVDRGDIPTEEIPVSQLRALAQHNDEVIEALVEKHWGAVRPGTPEEKLAEMRRLNNELNAAAGDPRKGRESFKNNCAKCHTFFGEGSLVGPDLTQSNRMDREYMLVSLVDPSLTVRKEYLQYIVETKDGGLFNGLIAERGAGSVTLINANAERTTIPAGEIAEIRESDQSLMPEGLVTSLPGDEIRDLFAYIQGPGPMAANE